jgi:hypothetical protein
MWDRSSGVLDLEVVPRQGLVLTNGFVTVGWLVTLVG